MFRTRESCRNEREIDVLYSSNVTDQPNAFILGETKMVEVHGVDIHLSVLPAINMLQVSR